MIIAIFSGVFLTLAIVGVLSVSPVLDSPGADRQVANFFEAILPTINHTQPAEVEQRSQDQPADPIATPSTVLGIQTQTGAVSAAVIYDLLNGVRRDAKQPALAKNRALEQAAFELITARLAQNQASQLDTESTIASVGYPLRTFVILEAGSVDSNWSVVDFWLSDPRSALLLKSSAFQDAGLAVLCNPKLRYDCQVLLVLASPNTR